MLSECTAGTCQPGSENCQQPAATRGWCAGYCGLERCGSSRTLRPQITADGLQTTADDCRRLQMATDRLQDVLATTIMRASGGIRAVPPVVDAPKRPTTWRSSVRCASCA
eukprot:5407079-Prymnesium_polylepis.1